MRVFASLLTSTKRLSIGLGDFASRNALPMHVCELLSKEANVAGRRQTVLVHCIWQSAAASHVISEGFQQCPTVRTISVSSRVLPCFVSLRSSFNCMIKPLLCHLLEELFGCLQAITSCGIRVHAKIQNSLTM